MVMDELQRPTNTELALKFQKGNSDAGQMLLYNFKQLIDNLVDFLYYGNYRNNQVVKNLVNLLSSSGLSEDELHNTLKVIREKYSAYDYEDVRHDIELAFILFVHDFKPDKIEANFDYKFEAYVVNKFHFTVKKETIDQFVDEPLYAYNKDINDIDDYTDFITLEDKYFVIDDQWIKGETCSHIFVELSDSERELLKNVYVDETKVKELAEKEGVTPSAIYHRLREIKKKIKK